MIPSNNKNSSIVTNKQFQLLLYKLANDALLLWMIVFLGLLILEGLVPSYFSAYLSFTKMILLLFALLAIIGYLGRRNGIVFGMPPGGKISKNKTLIVLLILSLALILNSLRGSGWFVMMSVSATTFLILLLLYKILIQEEQ